jgi:alkyl hydroperoxide reductase subunit AhpC
VCAFDLPPNLTKGAGTAHDFDAITVRRIRVVEPDGTLRMVISNHDGLPRDARGNRKGRNQRLGTVFIF